MSSRLLLAPAVRRSKTPRASALAAPAGGLVLAAALSLGASLTGCSVESTAEEDLTATKPSAAEVAGCKVGAIVKASSGESVVECTEPFAEAPFVRPPADTKSGTKLTFYAGVTLPTDVSNAIVLWDREGNRYVPVDAKGKPIAFTKSASLPKALHAPTNRVTYTLYQLVGTVGGAVDSAYGSAKSIRLTGARAVYALPGCVVDGHLEGEWEGTVSERLATPQGSGPFAKAFDASKRVPIHVTFTKAKQQVNDLADYDGKKKLSDQETFLLTGTIDNFSKDVSIRGTKYPSLAAMGAKNPFLGASSGGVELYRLGNMHGTMGDGHWVLTYPPGSQSLTGNGMTFTLTAQTAPSFLFGPDVSADELVTLDVRPHIPYVSNGHTVLMHPSAPTGTSSACGN
jgi:hypothetical protein